MIKSGRMPFDDIEPLRIKRIVGGFCQDRISDHPRGQINLFYEVRGFEVKINESRPAFVKSHEWTKHPVARMKYDPESLKWQLYWRRASGQKLKQVHADYKNRNPQ